MLSCFACRGAVAEAFLERLGVQAQADLLEHDHRQSLVVLDGIDDVVALSAGPSHETAGRQQDKPDWPRTMKPAAAVVRAMRYAMCSAPASSSCW
ncbi:hypothetical protein OG453_01275 [Streptomyces sp. NBC_01381]|uniref:hypothetical protein n=1 Tax=Streptomyces sp. NBC_01381 TaxID=2903845 RepID=UPI002256ED07|nr:hypothetical protein [Streptomyces sp. NBC_01381]MCX4665317.1 hypothetical protein [Streptomyces sp. NBC_01381]